MVGGNGCMAGGYLSPWLSAWLLAQAGAGSVSSDDISAAYLNPATMSWMAGSGVQLNGGITFLDVGFLPTGGTKTVGSRTGAFSPFSAYGVWMPKSLPGVSFGLSVNSPYSYAVQWPANWSGAFVNQSFFINSMFISPSVSVRIGDQLSLGGQLSLGRVNVSSSRALNRLSGANNTLPSESLVGQSNTVSGNVGLIWKPSTKLTLGASYVFTLQSLDIQGEATFAVPLSLEDFYPTTTFSLSLPTTNRLRVGFSYEVDSTWTLCLDVQREQWEILDTLRIQFENNTALLTNRREAWEWKSITQLHIASRWKLGRKMQVQTGLAWNPTPVNNNRLSPQLPSGSVWVVGLGVKWNLQEHVALQVGGNLSRSDERLGFLEDANFGGTYQIQDFSLQFGLNWRL